jgi:16S rRNA (guanine527-N7)-methyltransferase
MITTEEEAKGWLRTLSEVDDAAMTRLHRLVDMLVEENGAQNLVSAASLEKVWVRHIADSAQLLAQTPTRPSPWLDLGTGAGFPGLVIAALRPDTEVIMVESRRRRVDWLERVASALGLDRARIVGKRLEDVGTVTVGAISARAFAPLDRLLELSARFSTPDTIWLLPKGQSAQQELNLLQNWNTVFHVEQSLTDPHSGVIVGTLKGRKGASR